MSFVRVAHVMQRPRRQAPSTRLPAGGIGLAGLSGGMADRLASLSPPMQIAMLGVFGALGWAGWRRGRRMEAECARRGICGTGRTILHTAAWSLLAWPVGTGYLVGRMTGR